jgi:excisionase family DNA binding protein
MTIHDIELTPLQASWLLGMHHESIRRAIREGRLKANRLGHRTVYIPQREVERYRRELAR